MNLINQTVLSEYKKADKYAGATAIEYQKRYNDYLLGNEHIQEAAKPNFTLISESDGVIGSLEFPTVKMTETPIYKEETKNALFHYKYGSFPTVGKSGYLALEVDDEWKNHVFLVDFTQVKVGDCFYLRMGGKKYAYQIISLMEQSDHTDKKIVVNDQILTIEMKNPSVFTDNRLTIQSKQISKSNVQKVNVTPKITYSYSLIVALLLLLNMSFFCGLILLYQRYVRRAHAKAFRTKTGGYRKLSRLLQMTRGYYILLGLVMGFYLAVMLYRYVYLN